MNRLISCLAVLSVASAFGSDAYWEGGAGCISAADYSTKVGWRYTGGATSPLYDDGGAYVQFMGDNQDYAITLDRDMKVFLVQQYRKNQTLRLCFAPYTFKTVHGEGWRLAGEGSTVRLENGTLANDDGNYGIMTKTACTFVADGPQSVIDGHINVRDSNGATVIVTNGATVTKGVDIHGLSNNKVSVTGEGTLVLADQLNVGGWHKQGDVIAGKAVVTNNYFQIGAGAVVSNITNYARCGYYGSWSTLDIDGGTLYANELQLGCTAYASNNVIRLAHNGRAILSNTKYVCVATAGNNDPASCGNTLLYEDYTGDRATDGGFRVGCNADYVDDRGAGSSNNTVRIVRSTLDLAPDKANFITMGGANNGVVVSDGSHVRISATEDGQESNGSSIGIGYQNASHGNYMVIEGEGTTVSNFNKNAGTRMGYRNARHCRFEVRDGGEFYATRAMTVGTTGSYPNGGEHVVRVTSGGRFLIPGNELALGHYLKDGGFAANAVEVVDGGYMELLRLRLFGRDNTILVSNATLRVTNEFYPVYGQDGGSNTVITLAGESPRFEMTGGNNYFYSATKLRFVVPEGGYRTVPFERTASGAYLDFSTDDTSFEFDVRGMRKTGGKTVLMKAVKGIKMSDAQVAKMRENLPVGCEVYFAKDAETLAKEPDADRQSCTMIVLKVPRYGTVLSVR